MFIDKTSVLIQGGKGGNGAVSFRHEKFVDRGGPDGGDGGDGGSVILVGSNHENTLAKFRYQREIVAENGANGSKRKRHGRSGKDLEVAVPVGTVLTNMEGKVLADIVEHGQKVIVAEGGSGGFGNAHFTSSRRQTPRVAEKGEPGSDIEAILELKVIAEVGLIGLPNAGKSTLLSRISNAKPEIADYPFTTIRPNLGVADISKTRSLLVADIPGLIEGASEGKGLGDDFLRHVERTKVLIHVIDAYQEDIAGTYKTIRSELAAYKIDLSERPEIVALNKTEGLDEEIVNDIQKKLKKVVPKNTEIFVISAQSGAGLKELLFRTVDLVDAQRSEAEEQAAVEGIPVIRLENTDQAWYIEKTKQGFVVSGKKIERFALRTDFDSQAGMERLRDIMRKMGIMHELERQKIEPDELIIIGDKKEHGRFKY